jgi:hypothetical protein
MTHAPGRRFRLRLRPGRAVVSFNPDARQPNNQSDSGVEIVVSEPEAAFLVRQRAVDIIEVFDAPTDEPRRGQPT